MYTFLTSSEDKNKEVKKEFTGEMKIVDNEACFDEVCSTGLFILIAIYFYQIKNGYECMIRKYY